MNEKFDNLENLDESEEESPVCISLTDDDGNDIPFEVLDLIEYKDRSFVVLLPYEDEEADEVVIMEVIESDDPDFDEYIAIEDDALLSEVFNVFKEKNADIFGFED